MSSEKCEVSLCFYVQELIVKIVNVLVNKDHKTLIVADYNCRQHPMIIVDNIP